MSDECKYFVYRTNDCRRHAPIVIANPKYLKGSDQRVALTVYPDAHCPCGDFEPKKDD